MTAQQDMARLNREYRRLLRRLGVLSQQQREHGNARAITEEGDALMAQAEVIRPQLDATRQAAYDEQRRAERQAQGA